MALVENVLFVVFTEEEGEAIQIRIADRNEERIYNDERDHANWRKALMRRLPKYARRRVR